LHISIASTAGRRWAPTQPAALVDETAVGDGEDPGAELLLAALEVGDPREHSKEHLVGQIIGLARPLHPQVTDNRAGELVEEPLEGPSRIGLGGTQDVSEGDVGGQASVH
jgi:hypothetical protein